VNYITIKKVSKGIQIIYKLKIILMNENRQLKSRRSEIRMIIILFSVMIGGSAVAAIEISQSSTTHVLACTIYEDFRDMK
jgi:hypothetical protein